MPLDPRIKKSVERLTGQPFAAAVEAWENQAAGVTERGSQGILARGLLAKFWKGFPAGKEVAASPAIGRGYVRFGESVSAEEADRRNMKILESW